VLDFSATETRRNPYPLYERIRGTSPILQEPNSGYWMVFDYDSAKRVLSDSDVFSSRMGPSWMIFLDPPQHSKLRALILQAFVPRSVANLEPRIRDLSRQLLDRTIESGEMDLAADFSIPLPMMVISEMLGIPAEEYLRFKHWTDAILNMSYTISASGTEGAKTATQEFGAVTVEMNAYLRGVLEKRRTAPRDDLLTRLVQAEVDGERLTHEDILGFFQLLLLAGSETTTNLINNAILCFLECPDQLARVRSAPELLPGAIEEVLRYSSPLQWMYRVARRDVELHGRLIPAGKLVLAMIGSANRDPKQFPDADRFDITRDPNPHIAFGMGIHFCLGAALARLEARVALADLLERLRGLRLASAEPWEPRKGSNVLGPSRLPIRFESGSPR
jgi:cytochrome P450